jgi:hypothetical protein
VLSFEELRSDQVLGGANKMVLPRSMFSGLQRIILTDCFPWNKIKETPCALRKLRNATGKSDLVVEFSEERTISRWAFEW